MKIDIGIKNDIFLMFVVYFFILLNLCYKTEIQVENYLPLV